MVRFFDQCVTSSQQQQQQQHHRKTTASSAGDDGTGGRSSGNKMTTTTPWCFSDLDWLAQLRDHSFVHDDGSTTTLALHPSDPVSRSVPTPVAAASSTSTTATAAAAAESVQWMCFEHPDSVAELAGLLPRPTVALQMRQNTAVAADLDDDNNNVNRHHHHHQDSLNRSQKAQQGDDSARASARRECGCGSASEGG